MEKIEGRANIYIVNVKRGTHIQVSKHIRCVLINRMT